MGKKGKRYGLGMNGLGLDACFTIFWNQAL